MGLCKCDAQWSGVDEQRYLACGAPDCSCTEVEILEAKVEHYKEQMEDALAGRDQWKKSYLENVQLKLQLEELQTDHSQVKEALKYLATAASMLRHCQKEYMQDRGNNDKGKKVGLAAQLVDEALTEVEKYLK